MTVALASNADGSELLLPLFIDTAAPPQCFDKKTAQQLGVDYTSSRTAWMNSGIFNVWLSRLNERFKAQNRNVTIIVDRVSSHKGDESDAPPDPANPNGIIYMSNVSVVKLLPRTFSRYMPIARMKKRFKPIKCAIL
ncbi:TPA: hypothetical protein N0F65_004872 [Lagenidium giganteum]|uniref:DDE-1 domain-containing protein n=1 Tax=Lagenidium giganteum TaxID=4803 RepID=A0AAV2Z4C1_9STRA|nr:TPA: hypothetical protein N0F65_004872 [Lagenidium giganteum]